MNKEERAEIEKLMDDLDPETLAKIDKAMAQPEPMSDEYRAAWRAEYGRASGDKAAIVLESVLAIAFGLGGYLLYGSEHFVWATVAWVPAAICAWTAVATFIKT